MKQVYIDRLWTIILWAIFAGILILLFFYSQNRGFSGDEFEHIHTAWKILQGEKIYVDFFQHHHPFLSYLLVPIISIFGETTTTIFVGRYLMLLMVGGILIITYLLAISVFQNSEIGLISLILTTTIVVFYGESIETRPDVPQTLTGLISLYFLFAYYGKKSIGSLITSAVFLAVSFLFLQKAVALIISIGILFLYDLYGKRLKMKEVLLYAGIFLLTILPYYIYLLIDGSLDKYFVLNWTLNMNLRSSQGLSRFGILLQIFRENMITCMLYAVGAVTLLRSNHNKQFTILSLLLIVTVLLLYRNLWAQYFIMTVPAVGIISSYALCTIFRTNLSKFIVIIFAIYTPMSLMHDYASIIRNRGFDNSDQEAQLEKINYVLSMTDEDDKVYDGGIRFNVYNRDIDYFWYCLKPQECLDAYKEITDYKYDVYELISSHKPKVISTALITDLNDERIKNHYMMSKKYDDLMIRRE